MIHPDGKKADDDDDDDDEDDGGGGKVELHDVGEGGNE